ncbi:hypothetical protein GGR55DRAFT_109100 [Xylaria sp. FL0064]|nr:hypothetical protein GGR55DRAFT_109100 [Xylaria sp. FL0064]
MQSGCCVYTYLPTWRHRLEFKYFLFFLCSFFQEISKHIYTRVRQESRAGGEAGGRLPTSPTHQPTTSPHTFCPAGCRSTAYLPTLGALFSYLGVVCHSFFCSLHYIYLATGIISPSVCFLASRLLRKRGKERKELSLVQSDSIEPAQTFVFERFDTVACINASLPTS